MIDDLCSLVCDNGYGYYFSFARYAISASLLSFVVDESINFSFEVLRLSSDNFIKLSLNSIYHVLNFALK